MKQIAFLAAIVSTAALLLHGETGGQPIHIQLITGGHTHEISFYHVFDADNDFRIIVNPHPSAYQSDLRPDTDVLILYDLADTTGEHDRQNLRNFLESGKGMVVLHHALADNQKWPWWYEDVVGGRYLMAPEGDQPASKYREGVALKIRKVGRHPVTEGISDFDIFDEVYSQFWLSPKAQVLLEAKHAESQGPIAWISPYSKSRVVYIQLGHGREAHENPAYRKLVRNAVLWAAGKMQ